MLIPLVILGLVLSCETDNSSKYDITGTHQREGADPYLQEKYLELNNSPMQEKLRNIKPFPVGVVYYQQRGDNLDSAKKEFNVIGNLGFTALKQVQLVGPERPEGLRETVFHAALDAGISPWYYGKGGWENITPVYHSDRDRQYRQYHSQAKIGISRALMNQNIPFEYVTDRDLKASLAPRYPVIYMPYILALDEETFSLLADYVKQGGRLVADFPLCMLDNYGRLNKQRTGSLFAELFGFQTADYYHTFNSPKSFKGRDMDTQYGDIKLNGAKIEAEYSDGTPAILSHSFGNGSVLVFNFEAGRMMFRPGNRPMEKLVTWYTLGETRPSFEVSPTGNTMVYRRSAPAADHYFMVNDGEEEQVTISSGVLSYTSARDILNETEVPLANNSFSVTVPERSGLWIKVSKE